MVLALFLWQSTLGTMQKAAWALGPPFWGVCVPAAGSSLGDRTDWMGRCGPQMALDDFPENLSSWELECSPEMDHREGRNHTPECR